MEPNSDGAMGPVFDPKLIKKLPSSVARMFLGARLRVLRVNGNVPAGEVATATRLAPATIWRMENGDAGCRYTPADLHVMATAYGAGTETPLLTALAAATHQRTWAARANAPLPDEAKRFLDLESYARHSRWYCPQLLPDPVQMGYYAIEAAKARPEPVRTLLRGMTGVQLYRQARLFDQTATNALFTFVIDETALRRRVGSPKLMARQLRHLVAYADLPNVSLRILPLERSLHAGLYTGPFVIFTFPAIAGLGALPTAVYADPLTPVHGKRAAVRLQVFDHLHGQALNERKSCDLIHHTAAQYDQN